MSGVDCLLDTCEQFNSFFSATLAATSSSFSTLDWLISPFLGGVKESRFTRSPALSCGETHIKITLFYTEQCGWTFEIPRSGTLGLRSVAERRLFWFLKAVLKLSSLCKAAAETAKEDPSAIFTTKDFDQNYRCHLAWVAVLRGEAVHLAGERTRPTEPATSQVPPP